MDQTIPAMALLTSPLDDKWWEEEMPAKYFGTASYRNMGPQLGSSSVYVTEDSCLILISLPGIGDNFKFTITNDRILKIWSGTTIKPPLEGCFQRLTNNLFESGEFSMSVPLPGRVALRRFKMDTKHGILHITAGKK